MLDGTERNPPDPTYTCAVRMERKGGVYKLKEEREERGSEQKKKREKDINQKRREQEQRKRVVLITKENDRCTNFRPLTYLRVNLFKRVHS